MMQAFAESGMPCRFGSASFQAGVGEKARADARIVLEGIRNSVTQTRTRESNYVVWQKLANSGSVTETLALPSFTGPRAPRLVVFSPLKLIRSKCIVGNELY